MAQHKGGFFFNPVQELAHQGSITALLLGFIIGVELVKEPDLLLICTETSAEYTRIICPSVCECVCTHACTVLVFSPFPFYSGLLVSTSMFSFLQLLENRANSLKAGDSKVAKKYSYKK